MPIQTSKQVETVSSSIGDTFKVQSVELERFGITSSPVLVLDDFRVTGQPFGPHPHAGFSAITYVFQDSNGSLRSRDSLGNDIVMGPGGIVWAQAAHGMMHEELPAEPGKELHGLQLFVNLSAKHKVVPPQVLALEPEMVPEWQGQDGDRVRVVAGSYEGLSSPLRPIEPFTFLDIALQRKIAFTLESNHVAFIYVSKGSAAVRVGRKTQRLKHGHALALYGGSGKVTLAAESLTHVIILSGAEIHEPVLIVGPFVVSERSEAVDASNRYGSGEMGRLEPLGARNTRAE